jgi:SsrA-binding protein
VIAYSCCEVAKAKDKPDHAPRIVNRRATFDYHIDDRLECGIQLKGTEVKQLRLGQAQMSDAFAAVDKGQLFLHNLYIDPYRHASEAANHEPKRLRKLLAHKREITRLARATQERGVTLIPTAIYFKDGRAKVEIGLARGKRAFDKRQDLKKKAADRDIRKAISRR